MKSRILVSCCLLSLLALPFGCSQGNQDAAALLKTDLDAVKKALENVQTNMGSIETMKSEVATLKNDVQYEKDKQQRLLTAVDNALAGLSTDVATLKQADKDRYKVTMDLRNRVYMPIATPAGAFFLVVDNVEATREGSQVILLVGNPLAAAVKGFRLKAEWGNKPPEVAANATPDDASRARDQWEKSLARKDFSFPDRLESSKWNRVTCELGKFAPQDLGYLGLTLEPLEIALQR